MNTMDAWNFLMKISFCWLKHFHSALHQNLPHVRLSLKSSDYVEQNRDPPRCYDNMTTHCSHHISLANFRVSQNKTDKSYMTLSSITQTIIPLTETKQKRENCTCIDDGTETICLVEKHRLSMRCEPNFQRSETSRIICESHNQLVLLWYERKKMKFNQNLILYDKWEELRRWKFHTLVYSNRTTNHVTIKVKLFD